MKRKPFNRSDKQDNGPQKKLKLSNVLLITEILS